MGKPTAGQHNYLDVHLSGPIVASAYGFGSGALRLGSVTLMVDDRFAAPSLALAAIALQDVCPHLGRPMTARPTPVGSDNVVTALVRMVGRQVIGDFELVPANRAADGCGRVRFRFGSMQLTIHDLEAAERATVALVEAYEVSCAAFTNLPELAQIRAARDARRNARLDRRQRMNSTPSPGLLAPLRTLNHREVNERAM